MGVLCRGPYATADDIPSSLLHGSSLRGTVVSVADGDTVRFRHEPIFGPPRGEAKGKLVETTISVRLYGVDCPETAKKGKDGQPFSKEAKNFVTDKLLHKRVWLQVLGRDQYKRAIGAIRYGPLYLRDASCELLKRGYAVVYTGGGAKYGGKKSVLKSLESGARRKKKGVWSDPNFETPGEYKRKHKSNTRSNNNDNNNRA